MDGSFPIHKQEFWEQIRAGIDPKKTSFVDGSIVNDKPFSAAINAIRERAAYRDVDRRLVYIDPDPGLAFPPDGQVPSFLQTLEAAIFEIPLHAPILAWRGWARLAHFDQTRSEQNAEGPDCSSTGNCSPRV